MRHYLKAAMLSLVVLSTIFSVATSAFERTTIAENAQDVTPLLVGHSAPNTKLQTADGAPGQLKSQDHAKADCADFLSRWLVPLL